MFQMSTLSHTGGHGQQLKTRAVEEMRRFAVMFLYLCVLLGLFVLNERTILQLRGLRFSSQGFAIISALVLAMVMLVAEDLKLSHRLHNRLLNYPILHQPSLVFTMLFILSHIVEEVVVDLMCVSTILFIALIPIFAVRNISWVLAVDRLNAMLFGTPLKMSEAG